MIESTQIVVIGAGPAGCAAGRTLAGSGAQCLILDKLGMPGGLSRSLRRSGASFDVGPHRFYTQSEEVLSIWKSVLGKDLISVERLTRILYRGKYFNYPLVPLNALRGLGMIRSLHAAASYAWRQARLALRPRVAGSFEEWVTDRFGRVLYETFFKHYTEKVWGIDCSEISADWASQRIKGLNLASAVKNALASPGQSGIKTLVDRFVYPRYGSGYLYELMIKEIIAAGGSFLPHTTVTGLHHDDSGWAVSYEDNEGCSGCVRCGTVLSSMPITELVSMISPRVPQEVLNAAAALRYRNHYCVNLLVKSKKTPFPDNWIYVHSPALRTGRIANFANFSEALRNGSDRFPVAVEFFSFPGDEIDARTDQERIDLAVHELREMGTLPRGFSIEDAFVVFSESAYPIIAKGYDDHLSTIRACLSRLAGLQTMGRAGLFQYNNQDHSMMTGILAARNALGAQYDVWAVNIDAEYHESGAAPDLGKPGD